MDKLKRSLKHLFAPAIVLLLVVIMGVFSPVVSVAAALRLNTAGTVSGEKNYTISNLPTRTVELGSPAATDFAVPEIDNDGKVILSHAGQEIDTFANKKYTYKEIGQYEWRFYTNSDDGSQLYDTYTVTVTDTTYSMTMPSNVPTVAPRDVGELLLPLPSTYRVGGEDVEIETINSVADYATLKVKDSKEAYDYVLRAKVTLENTPITDVTIDRNGTKIILENNTGDLKVTYYLYAKDNDKKPLVALPLSNIELKNVKKEDVTFANIPTAPSVKNLSYYSNVTLTAPSADSAKYGSTSFTVEAKTTIVKVQAYLWSTEPSDWSNSGVHNLTVEKDTLTGKWVIKENGLNTENKYLEIDGLNVKIKKLGWYRFQFETSTTFGYQMDKDFKWDDTTAKAGDKNQSVLYWSDSVRIYEDTVSPNFAWVSPYSSIYDVDGNLTNEGAAKVKDMNDNFDKYLDQYTAYLPMTTNPTTNNITKKITVNPNANNGLGLVLPAIFPHDNATDFANMVVDGFYVDQKQDADGNTLTSNDSNYVWSSATEVSKDHFIYNPAEALQIKFVNADADRKSNGNTIYLLNRPGLYQVRVVVRDVKPIYEDESASTGKEVSGSAHINTTTKYLYFYVDDSFVCDGTGENSPTIDEGKVFQVSDVYLWEGHSFDFAKPSVVDNHTDTSAIKTDYYLVGIASDAKNNKVLSKLDVNANATNITVDLDNLYQYNAAKDENDSTNKWDLTNSTERNKYSEFYIYAVARNFNALQANLKVDFGVVTTATAVDEDEDDNKTVYYDGTYFNTQLFFQGDTTGKLYNEKVQYGYAWKRASFKINDVTSTVATSITADVDKDQLVAGKPVTIKNITATWGSDTDGVMSAAVYMVKPNNVLVPVEIMDSAEKGAEVVSAVAFNGKTNTVNNWCFTPGEGGEYILVLKAKDHASNKVKTGVYKITVDSSDDEWEWDDNFSWSDSLSTAADYTTTKTIALGDSWVLPSNMVLGNGTKKYLTKNRNLYEYNANGEVTSTIAGHYTITVLGVNDPDCIVGNKFIPNKTGPYVLRYSAKLNDKDTILSTKQYKVQVNNASTGVSSIRMGEAYDDKDILWSVEPTSSESEDGLTPNGQSYVMDKKSIKLFDEENEKLLYSEKVPAYAITLSEFTAANYGASTNFVVNKANLFKYLEPIYEIDKNSEEKKAKITGYMYPAIAIPMPNVITDTISSDEVEITVQKSGSSNFLVSSRKKNVSGNKASEIEKIGKYYVFRPTGKFKANVKDDYNADNYLQAVSGSDSSVTGVYTITYKTNTTSVTFNMTIGNLANGYLDWEKGFLTYDNNDGKGSREITDTGSENNVVIEEVNGHRYVWIDMSKVFFDDNDDMEDLIDLGPNGDGSANGGYDPEKLAEAYYWENVKVFISYEGVDYIDDLDWTDDEDETEARAYTKDHKYRFDVNRGSGTYKVTISLTNKYTNTTVSKSIEFTIDVNVSNKNTNLNNVWGIILVVLSLGLLAGVVYYFVKTARATRFIDTPRAAKGKGKDKTPKAVEAPKEDAK